MADGSGGRPGPGAGTHGSVTQFDEGRATRKAFRALKGRDLEIRPIHHRLEHRVRSHVLLCMLALYLEFHLRQAWRELTFTDPQPPQHPDPVAKATRSASATTKAASKRTATGQPAHSFGSLIAELATQTRNTIHLADSDATFTKLATPTPPTSPRPRTRRHHHPVATSQTPSNDPEPAHRAGSRISPRRTPD